MDKQVKNALENEGRKNIRVGIGMHNDGETFGITTLKRRKKIFRAESP